MAKEITVVEVFKKISIKITLKEAVSEIVDLIINIIYHHRSLNKKSIIYIGNLNTN